MKVVVDMNISPLCVTALRQAGHDAVHWMDVGPMNATDARIMNWASEHDAVVLTHDLDFGDLLGAGGAHGPSVIQLRARRLDVAEVSRLVAGVLRDCQTELERGALVTLDAIRHRVRLLPLHRPVAPATSGPV